MMGQCEVPGCEREAEAVVTTESRTVELCGPCVFLVSLAAEVAGFEASCVKEGD